MKKSYITFILLVLISTVRTQAQSQVWNPSACFYNPVVIVIPDSEITGNDTVVKIYYLENNKGAKLCLDDKTSWIQVDGSMHIRGDATAKMPKKQYAVKLSKSPSSGNFLGMKNGGKHWVFNDCGVVDQTLMRNVITFSAQISMGQYAPEWKWFELYIAQPGQTIADLTTILKSNYQGVYLNFDKIRFSKSRIRSKYDKNDLKGDYAIIQLNQLAMDKYDNLPIGSSQPPGELPRDIEIYEPKKDDIDKTAKPGLIRQAYNDWYFSQHNTSTNWAGKMRSLYDPKAFPPDCSDSLECYDEIRAITNYPSFAVYFLINELAKDPDGYHKSTFMVKQQKVCYAGPMWDKNKSYGNVANYPQSGFYYTQPEGWLFSDPKNTINPNQSPLWWKVLLSDSVFCKEVWKTWKSARSTGGFMVADTYVQLVNQQVGYLSQESVQGDSLTGALWRNNARWPSAFNKSKKAYQTQLDELNGYIEKRLSWLETNLPSLLQKSGFKVPSN